MLTATFFGLTLYSITQTNAGLLPARAARYLSVKILDTSSAATLFVTLVGALLVRHQFALSLVPRINYRSATATRTDVAHPSKSFKTWQVKILNPGLGAAIIMDTIYSIELSGEKSTKVAGHH